MGHVTLNLLLIPKFIEDGWEVHYIGDKKGIEHQEILKSGLDIHFHSIATGKLRRYFSWQNMLDIFKVFWGILQSIWIMLRIRPQVLFSKGGFVSVPPEWLRDFASFLYWSTNLTVPWAWPIKLPISLRLRCTLLSSKRLVSLR